MNASDRQDLIKKVAEICSIDGIGRSGTRVSAYLLEHEDDCSELLELMSVMPKFHEQWYRDGATKAVTALIRSLQKEDVRHFETVAEGQPNFSDISDDPAWEYSSVLDEFPPGRENYMVPSLDEYRHVTEIAADDNLLIEVIDSLKRQIIADQAALIRFQQIARIKGVA